MRDRYGATTARAQSLRFHTQTAGVSLTAQQPYNNVVRTAVEALAAVLGGTNSLHTNASTRPWRCRPRSPRRSPCAPSRCWPRRPGWLNVADPLGGSWYVEALTDRIEAEAEAIFAQIERLGGGADREHPIGPMTSGLLRGIEEGWFTGQIADAAFRYQTELEKGDKRIVGVNVPHLDRQRAAGDPAGQPPGREEQCAALAARRAARGPGRGGRRPGRDDRGRPDRPAT